MPNYFRVDTKEIEKIEKYQDVAREIKRMSNTGVKIVSLAIGVLGTRSKPLLKKSKNIVIETRIVELQISAFLYSARILTKNLEIRENLLSLKLRLTF